MSTPAELGLDTPTGSDLIRDGDDNITNNATVLAQLWDTRGHAQVLSAGVDLNSLTSGPVIAPTTALNTPPTDVQGIVVTRSNKTTPATSRVQLYYELGTVGRVWRRFRGSAAWTAWERIDAPRAADRLAAGANLNNITDSHPYVAYPGMDGILNAPPGNPNGVVQTYYVQELSRVQLYYELGVADRVWRRFRGTGSWTAWGRIDAAYAIEQSAGNGEDGGVDTPSALKTLPVVLSASTNFEPVTVATGGVRFPLKVNAPITRWRLCIRNHNYRTGVTSPGGASFTGLWVGARSGSSAAFAGTPTEVAGPFTLPAGGADYATPWSTAPIGNNADMLLSLGWTGAGEATRSPAGCYRTTSSSTGGATSGAGYTADVSVPFSWWLEVETAATTPVVAIWGDSISCGTGNDFPIHDSPLSQYCRTIGAIPFHAGYPGTNMGAWEPAGTNYAAWARFAHLARPDAVIHFMGQNDLITADLAELQRRFAATIGYLGRYISQNIYVATLTPTSTKTEAQNTIRQNYNAWLRTLPLGVRDVFEFGPAVANVADNALAPWADSGDALHLSTAGSTALAQAVTRPVTTQRTDRDTGPRDITALLSLGPNGSRIATLERVGATVRLVIDALTVTAAGNILLGTLPPGFRPHRWAYGATFRIYDTTAEGISVSNQGAVTLYGATAGETARVDMTWTTREPWPTTLPGSPA